jgi:uncharacterized repeat protein (TIGR01451 family)/gliding motility-associated-like protein
MKWKYTIFQSTALYFKKLLMFLFSCGIIILIFSLQHTNAQPIVLDVDYNSISFLDSNHSLIINNGNNGLSQGSVHRFNNIITKDGKTVYGLLTIKELKNAVIRNFDDDVTYGIPDRFQPIIGILTSEGGYVLYQLQFFDATTDEDIFLNNYSITGIDVDGNNNSNREFVEFGDFSNYTVNDPNLFEISTSTITGRTKFLGRSNILSGIGFDNTSSNIIKFTNPTNSILFALGQTGQNSEVSYSLQFGSFGGVFSSPVTLTNPILVATDDIGIPINSNTGGTTVSNVLSNDFKNGLPVLPSQVLISLIVPASHSGVSLNTSTGAVNVLPGTPAGNYTLSYQVCMVSNPYDRCDTAKVKVKILSSDLSISESSTPDTVIAGQKITYKITVTNHGPTSSQNVLVNDVIPRGLSLISAVPSVGTWKGSIWNIGNLADSISETLTIVAKVASNIIGSIQNSASVTSTTFDPLTFNNNISKLNSIISSANLSIKQTAITTPLIAGQNITYTLSVTNYGPSDASNVEVTDNLPNGLTIINVEHLKGMWTSPIWTIGTLQNGETATLKIEATINENLDGKISNSASIISNTSDPVLWNNSSTQVTSINSSADLAVTMTSNVDPMIAGESVEYTIGVINYGPSIAKSILLFDEVPSKFKQVEFSIDGGLNYSTWESPYSIETLKSGESVEILIKGLLFSDVLQNTNITNKVSVISNTPDKNTLNNSYHQPIRVFARSDISIVGNGPTTVIAGTKINYSFSVTNNGPSYASSMIIADNFPSGISNIEYSIDDNNTWEEWNGSLNIPIANFPDFYNILFRGNVSSGSMGNISNTASVSLKTFETTPGNNISNVNTTILREADLVISNTETISPLMKNGQVGYLITVINNGPSDASNVVITDKIDPDLISGVQYLNGTSWVPWNDLINIGTLNKDSSKYIQIRGTITVNAPDTIVNSASVASVVSDPFPSNNSQTIKTTLIKEADVSIRNSGPISIIAGEKMQYSIIVTNNSLDNDANNVLINDHFNNLEISNPEFSTNGGISWSRWTSNLKISSLNFGDSITLNLRCDVLPGANGILNNVAQVSCSLSDPVRENNSSSFNTTVTISSDIAVSISVLTLSENIVAGSIFEYLIEYSNNGPSDAPNFIISDIPSSELFDVEVSRNGFDFIPWNDSLNLGTLVSGGKGELIIRNKIKSNFIGSLISKAVVSSDASDSEINNNSFEITTAINMLADLAISLSGIPNPIIAGDTILYNLSIVNNGFSDAVDLNITNIIQPGLSNPLYSIDGGLNWYSWNGFYHLDTLVSKNSNEILIKSYARNDLINGSDIGFFTFVVSSTDDPVFVNNSYHISSTVQTQADLTIDMEVDNNKPSVGDQVKFTFIANNFGPSKALSVSVTDFLPSGYSYISSSGDGIYNPTTGVWTIGDIGVLSLAHLEINASIMPTGNYLNSAVIVGEVEDPNYSNNESSKIVEPDIEAIYTIASPQNVDSYHRGQLIAMLTDGDGNIISAKLLSGTLPLGTVLDSITGRISVTDSTLLIAGNYTIAITTMDVKGGKTSLPVTIIFNSDTESVYYTASPRNVDDYAPGETLATVSDANGKIVYYKIISGSIPPGTNYNYQNGEITVANASYLVPGNYPMTIVTADVEGGKTTQKVTIEFIPDIESVYVVKPPIQIGDYSNGDTLASVTDGDGTLISAILIAGVLPGGTELNSITGDISITNSDFLSEGTFTARIQTIDIKGGITLQLVTIIIKNSIGSVYTVEPPRNVDSYRNGDTLAFVKNISGEIFNAELESGSLPMGTNLNYINGVVTVIDSSLLVAGSFTSRIEINNVSLLSVTILINPDIESVYSVEPPQDLFNYVNGEILASVTDGNGSVVSAGIQFGTLPSGVSLDSVTGEIFVADATQLVTGTYTFNIITTDITGGITIQPVVISFISADLSITKGCSPGNLVAGEKLIYTITVTNHGPNNAQGVTVTDLLSSGLTFISSTPSVGNWVSPNWNIGDLANGATVTLKIEALIHSNFMDTLSNTATVTCLTSDPVPENNSATVNSTVNTRVNLSATLTGNPNPVIAGESITYNITVVNNSPSDAKRIVLLDDLPDNVNFVSASDGGTYTDGYVEWNMASLKAYSSHTFSMVVRSNSSLAKGSVISNWVTVKSDNSSGTVNSNIVEISVKTHSNLSIQKTTSSEIVQAGGNFTYSIITANNGPSNAINVIVTDTLPSSLTFVSASGNGTFNNGVVTWSPGKLITGNNYVCSLVVKVNDNVPNETIITNNANVISDSSDGTVVSEPTNVLVKTHSNLSIQKIASSDIVQAGGNFTYSINATNNGPSDATNVQITDELPSFLTFVSASGNGTFNNGVVTWSPGKLVNGEKYTCSLIVTVKGNVINGTVITNKANVNSDTSEGPIESEPINVTVKTNVNLEIVKTTSKEVVIAGEEVTYSIEINNTGLSDAINVAVTDTLSKGLTFVNASNGGVFTSGKVIWIEPRLAGSSKVTYNVTVRVNKDVLKSTVIANRASVNSENSVGFVQCIPVNILVDAESNLKIQKSGNTSVISGENLTYSIQVSDDGPSDAPNVKIKDILPDGVSFVSATNDATVSNGIVNWNLTSLKTGSNITFSLVVKVDENIPDGNQISNTASAICDNSSEPVISNEVTSTVTTFSVIANDDEGIPVVGASGGIVVENVLSNDSSGNKAVDNSIVDISFVSSSLENVSLNIQTGSVIVSGGTPAGIYQLVYRICLKDYPTTCDDATVTFTVLASEIEANSDTGIPLNNTEGGVAVENVTANDLLNNKLVKKSDVIISLLTPASESGIVLNTQSGEVTVLPGIQPGSYELTYRICEILNPDNCDDAVVTVTILTTEECELLIPTGFSPNEDGIHDYFKIKCIEKYPEATLEVFNRWGNLVYKKEKYGNVDQWGEAEAWWGGYSNRNLNLGKEKLPPGTYFFILKLNSGAEAPITGSVFLNR